MGESKRDMVLSELITTESAYVEDLQAIHTYYVKPSASSNCLKHSEWSTLFANLPELTTVNRLFLKQLVTVDDYETLGKLFVAFAPEFACYEVYIVQVEDAFKLIREKEKNTAFQSFLNDCHIKSHQALGLETYLLKPLQRLLKYPLLLGEILKRTPEQNTNEREALEEALEQMKILSLNVNEAKRDKEKYEELVAMRRHVDGWDDFKLSANDTGPFILDGDVKIVTRSGSLKSFKVRHLMLFQKYILICKPARFFDSYNYILREKLDLGTMKIKDMMDEGNLENAWSVSCSFGKRTFFHDSYEEKEKWMSSVVVELFKITGGDSGRSSVTSSNQDLANAGEMSKEDLEKEIQIARNTRKGVQNLLNTYTQQSSFGDMEARKALEVNLQNLDNKLSELNAMYEKYTVGQTVDEESDEWSDFSSDDDDDDWRSVDGGNSSAATSVYDMRLSEPELFVAVYSFTGESEKDLSFEEGDYLYVLEKQDEDGGYEWWLADKDGEQGYVPSTYITPYVDESENPTENEWVEGGDLEQRNEEGYGEHYELEKNEQTRYDLPCEVEQNDFGEQPYQTDEGVAQGYEQSYETEQNDYYHGEQYQQEEGYNENDRSYYEEASGNYADGNEYEMNPAGDVEQHIEPRQPDYGNFDSYEDEWGDNNEDENNPQASASVTKDYYYQDPVQPEAPVAVNAPESQNIQIPEGPASPKALSASNSMTAQENIQKSASETSVKSSGEKEETSVSSTKLKEAGGGQEGAVDHTKAKPSPVKSHVEKKDSYTQEPTKYEMTAEAKLLENELGKELSRIREDLCITSEDVKSPKAAWDKVSMTMPVPHSLEHYRRSRKTHASKLMKVREATSLRSISDMLSDELKGVSQSEVDLDVMPVTLFDFYNDRSEQLLRKKYLYALRWGRYCYSSRLVEKYQELYKERVEGVKGEFEDCTERCRRLAEVVQYFDEKDKITDFNVDTSNGSSVPRTDSAYGQLVDLVEPNDLRIYARSLIQHSHSSRRLHAFFKLFQWIPSSHRYELGSSIYKDLINMSDSVEETSMNSMGDMRDVIITTTDLSAESPSPDKDKAENESSEQNEDPDEAEKNLPEVEPEESVSSGNSADPFQYTSSLPQYIYYFEDLKPIIGELIDAFHIEIGVEYLENADGLEFFYLVNRKFQQIFRQQTANMEFPAYDCAFMAEDSINKHHSQIERAFKDKSEMDYLDTITFDTIHLKESSWKPYITFQPDRDAGQEKRRRVLKETCQITDNVLQVEFLFILSNDFNQVYRRLKELSEFTYESQSKVEKVSNNPVQAATQASSSIFKKLYRDGTDGVKKSPLPEKDNNSLFSRKMGASDHGKTRVPKSMYLSFMYLRHIRIRDYYTKIYGLANYFQSLIRRLTIDGLGILSVDFDKWSTSDKGSKTATIGDENVYVGSKGGNAPSNHFNSTDDVTSYSHLLDELKSSLFNVGTEDTDNHIEERGCNVDKTTISNMRTGKYKFLANTAKQRKIAMLKAKADAKFMETTFLENRNDFYHVDFHGHTKVKDSRGVFICYESTGDFVKELSEELLQLASFYLLKSKRYEKEKNGLRRKVNEAEGVEKTNEGVEENDPVGETVDLSEYGSQNVDRVNVLLDLWTCEFKYQEAKTKVIDCYLHIYENVVDPAEQKNIAQTISNLIYSRPRYDFKEEYFTKTYKLECDYYTKYAKLLTDIINQTVIDEREYLANVYSVVEVNKPKNSKHQFTAGHGFPEKPILEQPIHLQSHACRDLKPQYLFEYHSSLAIINKLPKLLEFTLQTLTEYLVPNDPAHDPTSDIVDLMSSVLDIAVGQWEGLSSLPLASLTSDLAKKDKENTDQILALQYNLVIDNPVSVDRLVDTVVATGLSKKKRRGSVVKLKMIEDEERKEFHRETARRMCDIISYRQKLIESWHETEILTSIYQNQCQLMGQETHHAYMRCVPFETRLDAYNPEADDSEIKVNTGKISVDTYKSNKLRYALSELDDDLVKPISFFSSDTVKALLNPKGVKRIKTVLQAQIAQKNALLVGIFYNEVGLDIALLDCNVNPKLNSLGDSILADGMKQDTTSESIKRRKMANDIASFKDSVKQKFLSIKERKSAVREASLQMFSKRYYEMTKSMGESSGNKELAEAVDDLKDDIVLYYCDLLSQDLGRYALRVQIYRYYESLKTMLKDFPQHLSCFVISDAPSGKFIPKNAPGNPRASISSRSASLIPTNPSERRKSTLAGPQMVSQRRASGLNPLDKEAGSSHIDDEKGEEEEEEEEVFVDRNLAFQNKLSKKPCRLVSIDGSTMDNPWFVPHHTDIMDCLSEESMTGQLKQLSTLLDISFSLHDIFLFFYGQARLSLGKYEPYLPQHKSEGIASEMHKIQLQIDNLRDPKSPRQIADFLVAWRSLLFMGYDYTMRYTALSGLLLRKRLTAYQILKTDNHLGMDKFKHTSDSIFSTYFQIPEFLDNPEVIKDLFPQRWFAHHYGPCPGILGHWRESVGKIEASVARLSEVDKTSVIGELYGLTALLEDVCNDHGLNFVNDPQQSLRLLRLFTRESMQLEQVKSEWAMKIRSFASLESYEGYVEFDHQYKNVIISRAAKQYKKVFTEHRASITAAMADKLLEELPPLHRKKSFNEEGLPETFPELEYRQCQLGCLLSYLECEDIKATLKEIGLLHALHVADRESERSSNSIDFGEEHTPIDFVEKCAPLKTFITKIFDRFTAPGENITFQKSEFQEVIQNFVSNLGVWMAMCIQDCNDYHLSNFRHLKHMLYLQEQKNRHLQNKRKEDLLNFERNSQVYAANFNTKLLMEVSALYGKLTEMERAFSELKTEVKAETRAEYEDLVQGLSSQSFALRNRFQEYRGTLYEDVLDGLTEARKEALIKLKQVSFRRSKEDKEREILEVEEAEEDGRDLASENSALWTVVLKLKTMNEMKQLGLRSLYEKKISKLKAENNSVTKKHWELTLEAEAEKELLKNQNNLIQSALQSSDEQLSSKRKEFEEQNRMFQALSKWKMSKEDLIQKLEEKVKKYAKLDNLDVDEILNNIEEKDSELKKLHDTEKKRSQTYRLQDVRNQKQLRKVVKEMRNERNIKQDAFSEIDKLRQRIRDYEDVAAKFGINLEALAKEHNPRSRTSTVQTERINSPRKTPFLTAQLADLLRPTTAPNSKDTIPVEAEHTSMPPIRDPLRRPRTQMDIREGKKSSVQFPYPNMNLNGPAHPKRNYNGHYQDHS
eukprot:Nk52_evm55s208 gene=Nk52_evmTU55s208